MKTLRNFSLITAAAILISGVFISLSGFTGKQSFKTLNSGSSMSIKGTSSLHDWTVDLNEFNCNMTAIFDASLMKIENVTFRGRAKTIKSDSNTMDKKIQEALKTDKFPEVRFTVNKTRDVTLNNNRFTGVINGDLSIAGRTRTENINFTGHMISDNRIQIKGSKKVKMTDFNISPPTAMLGTLKTGDEVTISFTLVMAVN